jgi:penicillin-binding protein 1A
MHKNVNSDQIPSNLKNAYVAIEDERFYKHHGVDIKRTSAAILSYAFRGNNTTFGGSSITQQLVKNITGNDSNSISRKMNEWLKAVELETCMSKDEILTSYLNIIYVGPNIYGVEMGAEFYFDKNVSELSLAECAFLAGINHSPNYYNPFAQIDHSEKAKSRTKLVLDKMLELKYISNEDYQSAANEVSTGLKFKKGNVYTNTDIIYSYHTDALLSEVISDIRNKEKIDEKFATNYLYMGGLKIYSTQDSKIQSILETEFEKKKYITSSAQVQNTTSQAAMVVIDHSSGYVVGVVRWAW